MCAATLGAADDTAELIRESEAMHRRLETRDRPVSQPPRPQPEPSRPVETRETTQEDTEHAPLREITNGRKSPVVSTEPIEGKITDTCH